MRFTKAAAAVVFALVSLSANAAELFVSTSGNDANPGTLAAPFLTLTKAAYVAKPGDVVNVRGGVYNTSAYITSKGLPTARITFRSYPGEKAILDGTGLSSTTIVVSLSRTEYVDFTGFEIRNAPYIALNVRMGHDVRVADNVIHHSWRNAVYVGADTMNGVSNVVIENNVAYNNVLENTAHATSGGWAGTLVASRASNVTFRGNRVYENDGEAIIVNLTTNAVVYGNVTYDNYSQGVFLDNARYVTVDSNLIYSTGNTRYFRSGYPGQGIAVANETYTDSNPSSDNTIINNIVVGTRWGFYYGNFENGGGLKNTRVANNTFHNTAQEPVVIATDAHANSVIENNIFSVGGKSGSVAGGGVTFRNNAWYGVSAGTAAGANDVIGNPSFVRAGGFNAADYRIAAGSIAIGRAADASAIVKTDYFGNARALPFDIGAHQLSSGAAADVEAPSVPVSVRAIGGDSASISITWNPSTDNVGVTGYTVYRGGQAVGNVTTNSWTDRNLTAGILYTYAVVAYDAAGNRSAMSSLLSVAWSANEATTDTTAPTAPRDLQVTGVTASSVSLAWSPSTDDTGVTEYHVYRDNELIGKTITNAWTATSLAAGTTYSFSVVAVDAAGNVSNSSIVVTATTLKAKRRATR